MKKLDCLLFNNHADLRNFVNDHSDEIEVLTITSLTGLRVVWYLHFWEPLGVSKDYFSRDGKFIYHI